MDSRFFWIMVTTLGLFLIFSYFFPGSNTPTQTAQTETIDQSTSAATPAVTAAEGGGQSDSSIPSDLANITVTTPNYVAVFTERGGRLTSFKLSNYFERKTKPDQEPIPVELVTMPNSADWPMLLSFSDPQAPQLMNAAFVADQKSLDLQAGQSASLTLTYQDPQGLKVNRILTFSGDNFLIDQKILVENEGSLSYGGFVTMRLNTAPFTTSTSMGRYDEMAAYINGELLLSSPDDAREDLGDFRGGLHSVDWIGYMNQYFLTALVSANNPNDPVEQIPTLTAALQDHGGVAVSASQPLQLLPNQKASYNFNFYYGPKSEEALKAAGHNLDQSIDLGWFSFLATPLAALLHWFYSWVGNYGVAIILVTVLIKVVLWPLTAKSYRSMKDMQKLQPKILKLREKYADDREAMNREVMQLYKTFKVNPFGGCLPILLQIPFFIAFYRVLDSLLELRGAPFMLWIQDLSAPDRLGSANFTIPFFDAPTGIPVLTLLMGASMFIQQKMTPNTMADPTQAKIMMMMPIIFTFILINMPSGLVLYWLVNNVLSIFQQKMINKSK